MNGPHLRWSCYAIIVNGFVNAFLSFNIVIRNAIFSFVMTKLLTIFIKKSIIDVWWDPKCTFVQGMAQLSHRSRTTSAKKSQKQPSRGVLRKSRSKNIEQIYRSVIFETALRRHGCSPVNLLHIFRTP